MYMRTGGEAPSGAPPVIAAADGDVKVAPEAQAPAEAETVGDAVYNRVAGNAPAAEEQVVDGAEEPREISRIVLPSPQEEPDQALVKPVGEAEGAPEPAGPGETAAEAAPTNANVGPRRVRTYVVRPDGTIAETTGTGAAGRRRRRRLRSNRSPPAATRMPNPMVPGAGADDRDQRSASAAAGGTGGAEPAPQSPPPQEAAVRPAPAPAVPDPEPACFAHRRTGSTGSGSRRG
jgi:hypothetical protein